MGNPRLTSLPIADAARVLATASGERITMEMLGLDIRAGAPTNPDGTLNLITYGAWLISMRHGKGPPPARAD